MLFNRAQIAGFARHAQTGLELAGFVGSPDGAVHFADRIAGSAADAAGLGIALADRLLAAGAGVLLDSLRGDQAG